MGLWLRISIVTVLLLGISYFRNATRDAGHLPQLKADVCEMLRDSHEDLQNEYPNEYYDCHAHSRFEKMGSLSVLEDYKHS